MNPRPGIPQCAHQSPTGQDREGRSPARGLRQAPDPPSALSTTRSLGVDGVTRFLQQIPNTTYLSHYSALDTYFRLRPSCPGPHFAVTEASLIDLARAYPDVRYPGTEWADASLTTEQGTIYLLCVDSVTSAPIHTLSVLNLLYDVRGEKFLDPRSIYPSLREKAVEVLPGGDNASEQEGGWRLVADAAILLSRYGYTAAEPAVSASPRHGEMSPKAQRLLLELLLTGRRPDKGFRLLHEAGFVERHWPELARLDETVHSKAYHPEGNVWEHTLATFEHRKTQELVLSLGLLFHDCGKPLAGRSEGRMFDGHAEIGASIARGLLGRLGFEPSIIEEVYFLVRHHMLPPFISKLATRRIEPVMASPLFPALLELYRCDELATFRGPDGYYEACKTYRAYLRNVKNPYREADGKKVLVARPRRR